MNLRCGTAKRRIVALFDENPADFAPAGPLAGHIQQCGRCRRFAEDIRAFRADLLSEARAAEHALGEPDLSFLDNQTATAAGTQPAGKVWYLSRVFRVAAAASVLMVFGFSGYYGIDALQKRSVLRQETEYFVASLFGEPLFNQSVELSSDADLVSSTDIVSELLVPPPPGL